MMKLMRMLCVLIMFFLSFLSLTYNQNLSQFEHLQEPQISTLKNQTMLVVEAQGDPNVIGGKAFGLLFQLYFTMKETPKGPSQPAPRARWPASLGTSSSSGIK